VGHDGRLRFLDITAKDFVYEEDLGGEGHYVFFEHPFLFVGFDKESPLMPGVPVGMLGVYNVEAQPLARKDLIVNEATPFAHSSRIAAITVGGALLISGGADGIVRLWKFDDAAGTFVFWQNLIGHVRPVTSLCFVESDGGGMLWSGSEDRTIRIWNITSSGAQCVDMKSAGRRNGDDPGGHSLAVTSLKLVPGTPPFILSAGVDQKLIVWNATTNEYCGGTECGAAIQEVELGTLPDPTADGNVLNCLFLSCRTGDFQVCARPPKTQEAFEELKLGPLRKSHLSGTATCRFGNGIPT